MDKAQSEPTPPTSELEASDTIVIVDTDGDVSEYKYEGQPGTLTTVCNGKRSEVSVTAIDYNPTIRRVKDCTGSLILPAEPSPDALVAQLRTICELANVPFREIDDRLVAPWGAALPRALCVRLTVGPTSSYTRESLLHIGISNSVGVVSHFPSNEIIDADPWPDCVSVALDKTDLDDEAFDAFLAGHVLEERERLEWAPYQNGYDVDLLLERGGQGAENNCFSFCARFLSSIRYAGIDTHDKMALVEHHGIA